MMKKVRDNQIHIMRQHGFTLNQIAEYFGLSYSGVRVILSRFNPNIGPNEKKGIKQTLDMTLNSSSVVLEDQVPEVESTAQEESTSNFIFSNRLTGVCS